MTRTDFDELGYHADAGASEARTEEIESWVIAVLKRCPRADADEVCEQIEEDHPRHFDYERDYQAVANFVEYVADCEREAAADRAHPEFDRSGGR